MVRLLRRKSAGRDRKRPEVGLPAAVRGSDKWPEKPTFCGFPTADQSGKRMSRLGRSWRSAGDSNPRYAQPVSTPRTCRDEDGPKRLVGQGNMGSVSVLWRDLVGVRGRLPSPGWSGAGGPPPRSGRRHGRHGPDRWSHWRRSGAAGSALRDDIWTFGNGARVGTSCDALTPCSLSICASAVSGFTIRPE